jgi:hypothetical protein
MRISSLAGFLEFGQLISGKVTCILISGQESAVLVGTGDDAVAAADAFILVYPDDAVLPLLRGSGDTDLNARRVLALETSLVLRRGFPRR